MPATHQSVQNLIDDAGRHMECSIYESPDVQAFLKMLRESANEQQSACQAAYSALYDIKNGRKVDIDAVMAQLRGVLIGT